MSFHDAENEDAVLASVLETIGEHEFSIQCVMDCQGAPTFAYTTGLCTREGHPYELAASGMPPDLIEYVLNATPGVIIASGVMPFEGLELDGVIDSYKVRLHRVADTSIFVIARAIYGQCPETWQVLWPDVNGRFPGDPGFACPELQPIL